GPGAPGAGRDLLAGWDRWPGDLAWSHDSRALYVAADDGGRRPVFRVDAETGEVRRITADDGAYTDLNPGPDGRYLYALRSAVDSTAPAVPHGLGGGAGGGRARRARRPGRPGHRARAAGGGPGHRRRRPADPVLAGAAGDGQS